ncbi:MAG: hypothetical protein H6740_23745, partial [Alphaproteobacteria bacterium]|nr:hypothetical protein [Alphaproteobacteria bacterium]
LQASSLAGGDAAATALAAGGLSLAWTGWPLLGGLLAGLSVGVKPIAVPLLPALLLASLRPGAPRAASLKAAGAALLAAAPFWAGVAPLLRPRPRSGILGSWWLSSEGVPPGLTRWPELLAEGALRLAELPSWTLLQLLLPLALIGAWRARERAAWLSLALALGALLAPATLIGEQLRPRYLGPASVLLVVLAGRALQGRLAPLALLASWPALAFLSQLSALRAQEEQLPGRPILPWVQAIDVRGPYMDSGVCGAGELRALAERLAQTLPEGGTLRALRLRDGREGELTWPLQAARPDLHIEVLDGGRCPDAACLSEGPPLVLPGDTAPCQTPVVDPGEAAVVEAAQGRLGIAQSVYRLVEP